MSRFWPAIFAGWLIPAALSAQVTGPGMPDGVWRGWMHLSYEDSVRVNFLVENRKKDLYITMRRPNSPDYPMGDIKLKDDVLTFNWSIGAGGVLSCRLSRRDGRTFHGGCGDVRPNQVGKQLKVDLMMAPPDGGGR